MRLDLENENKTKWKINKNNTNECGWAYQNSKKIHGEKEHHFFLKYSVFPVFWV